eukprot:111396-Amphidinium_carterae.1
MELMWLSSQGKSVASLERCMARSPLNVNQQNEAGATALMFATAAWSPQFVQRLLAANADPNIADKDGRTAMDILQKEIAGVEEATKEERDASRKR